MKARQIVIGLALGVLLITVFSCSTTPTGRDRSVPLDLQIGLKPSLLASLVDSIQLTVHYQLTGEILVETFAYDEKIIRHTLVLTPADSVEICLYALTAAGQILYRGCETLNVLIGDSEVLTITMKPEISMLRPSPIYHSAALNEEVSIGIDLYNITDLYGAAFRLYFDADALTAKAVEPGSFLGEDILFTPNIQEGYVAVGISRLPPEMNGVDDSGRLATIVFETVAIGESALEFDTERLLLTDQAGQPIPEAGVLVTETGTIRVADSNQPPD